VVSLIARDIWRPLWKEIKQAEKEKKARPEKNIQKKKEECSAKGAFEMILCESRKTPLSSITYKVSNRNENDEDGSSKTQREVRN
jgi:hypothetical protein